MLAIGQLSDRNASNIEHIEYIAEDKAVPYLKSIYNADEEILGGSSAAHRFLLKGNEGRTLTIYRASVHPSFKRLLKLSFAEGMGIRRLTLPYEYAYLDCQLSWVHKDIYSWEQKIQRYGIISRFHKNRINDYDTRRNSLFLLFRPLVSVNPDVELKKFSPEHTFDHTVEHLFRIFGGDNSLYRKILYSPVLSIGSIRQDKWHEFTEDQKLATALEMLQINMTKYFISNMLRKRSCRLDDITEETISYFYRLTYMNLLTLPIGGTEVLFKYLKENYFIVTKNFNANSYLKNLKRLYAG